MSSKALKIRIIGDASKLGEAFDDASKGLDGFGAKIEGFGSKIGGFLGGAALAGGALAGAALVQGFSDALEAGDVEARLAARMGISNPQFAEDLGGIAGDLYADGFGEGVGDSADAIRQVFEKGLLPEDAINADIEAVTAQVMTLSDVMGQDLGMTTEAVANLMRNGLAPDAEAAMDILTRGMQQGADKSGDLLETFQEYSTIFRDIGIDGATATGLMSQGLKAGARDADTVADALKEMAIRGQDASKLSADSFSMIGLDAEKMTQAFAAGGPKAAEALDQVLDALRSTEDPIARNAAAVGLFGTKAEDLGDALFALDPSEASQSLGDIAGATDKLGGAYDTTASRIESFKRKGLQALSDFVGDTVIPRVEQFVGWAQKLGEEWGPKLAPYVEMIGSTISNVFSEGGVLSTAQNVVTSATGVIRSAFATISEWWDANGPAMIAKVQPIAEKIGTILTGIAELVGTVLGWIKSLWEDYGDLILDTVKIIWDTIWGVISGVLDVISGVIDVVMGVITGDWGRAWDGIKGIVSGVWNTISSVVSGAINLVWTNIQMVGRAIGDTLSGVWGGIKDAAGSAWSWIKDTVSSGVSGVWDAISSLPGKILGIIGSIGSAARSIGSTIMDKIGDGLGAVGGAIAEVGSKIWASIKNFINSNFIDKIRNFSVSALGVTLTPFTGLPRLAEGGIATGPMLAMIGDNRSGKEAVVPLERAHEFGFGGGGGAPVSITIQTGVGDPVAIGRALIEALDAAGRHGAKINAQMVA